MTHVYRWRRYRPDLFGRLCLILARGRLNSILVQFEDGTRHVVSRYSVRKIKPE